MYVGANSEDSDQTALNEQSDQDLHCLPFFLHLLEALLHCKNKLFYIKDNYGSLSECPNIKSFYGTVCLPQVFITSSCQGH